MGLHTIQPIATPANNVFTGLNTGRFRDKGEQFFNVKSFGALGNGITDDTTAIQAAINAAKNALGGVVFFPAGYYIVSATIITYPHIVLEGVSPHNSAAYGSVLFLANGSDCDVVRSHTTGGGLPTTDVNDYNFGGGIRYLGINGNKAGQSGANDPVTGALPRGITVSRWANNSFIEHVMVQSCKGHGISVQDSTIPLRVLDVMSNGNDGAGYYIASFCVAIYFDHISGDGNLGGAVRFGALTITAAGIVFVNPHFESNPVSFLFDSGGGANVAVINGTGNGIRVSNGSMTNGSPVLTIPVQTSTIKAFTAADVGRYIIVSGAGAAAADLKATIIGYTSATQVILSTNALTTTAVATVDRGNFAEYTAGSEPRLTLVNCRGDWNAKMIVDNISGTTLDLDNSRFVDYHEKGDVAVRAGRLRMGDKGKLASTQTVAPALSAAAAHVAASAIAGTDVKGVITLTVDATGIGSFTNLITVTFADPYTTVPVVLLTCQEAAGGGSGFMVKSVSINGFTIMSSSALIASTVYPIGYMVVE